MDLQLSTREIEAFVADAPVATDTYVVISDNGTIAGMLGLGNRPVERVALKSDARALAQAMNDLKALHSGALLLLAEKRGEVARVGVPPPTTARRVVRFDDGKGRIVRQPGSGTPRRPKRRPKRKP